MSEAKALWHISPYQSEIRTNFLLRRKDNEVEISAHFSLISSGTETLVAKGAVPKDLYTAMQVPHMAGSFDFPIKYAYSLVGEVLTKEHAWYGRMVHVMYPHQDRLLVEAAKVSLIPDAVPARRASLASNLETAVNAIWDAKISLGDKVLIFGFGLVGSLLARILVGIPGVDLWIVEQDLQRIDLAKQMGFQQIQTSISQDDFDCAFHTSTSQVGLQKCIDCVGMEGQIMELSWYGDQKINLNLGASFHYQRKKIISTQVAQIPNSHRARWNYQRRKQLVFELLKDAAYDLHLSHDINFEDTPALFDRLRNGDREGLAWCINY